MGNRVFHDIRDFGARIQDAIEACAKAGGGTVLVPAGRWVTGPLFLKSDVTLQLEAGAVLKASEDVDSWPVIRARWEGSERETYAPVIGAVDGSCNIAVVGRGTVDGSGAVWWRLLREKSLRYPRPRCIAFTACRNVRLAGIFIVDSPSWTINPVRCDNVVVDGVSIRNPADAPNTDGINPDSCSAVRVANCCVDVGDDCITIKSGTEQGDPSLRAPCRDVTVTNCVLRHGHGGVVIGSEMTGGVRNVVISNCVFLGTDRGIRMKSRRGRGGLIQDVRAVNLVMEDVPVPFTMNLYYNCGGARGDAVVSDKAARPVDAGTPRIRGVSFTGVTARGVQYAAAFLYGLAEAPVEDVSFSDVSIEMKPDARPGEPDMADDIPAMRGAGFWVRNAAGISFDRVRVRGQSGPAILIDAARDVEIRSSGSPTPDAESPVVRLRNVHEAFLHGCRAASGTGTFLRVEGAGSSGIRLAANDLSGARLATDAGDGAPGGCIG